MIRLHDVAVATSAGFHRLVGWGATDANEAYELWGIFQGEE